jgi:hypothetical protein
MVVRTESALGLASIPSGKIYERMSVCEHLKFALISCIIKWHEKKHIPHQTLPCSSQGGLCFAPAEAGTSTTAGVCKAQLALLFWVRELFPL